MKKVFLTVSLVASFLFVAAQTVWIADNRPIRPGGNHVVSSFQAALDSASPGDIIHITPSQFGYGSPTISKSDLTIFGIGYNPKKDQPNKVWVTNLTITNGVTGVRVSGINVSNDFTLGSSTSSYTVGNIIIENGQINRITILDYCCSGLAKVSNVVVRNCVIGQSEGTNGYRVLDFYGNGDYESSTSIVIINNVIMGSSYGSANQYSVAVRDGIVKNNLFLGNGNDYDNSFTATANTTISNNIFLGRDANGGTSNCTFNNNITFGSFNTNLPIGASGNTGDSLLINTDPMLVNVPIVDDWSYAYDPTPDIGSPAIGTGNDGGDIGLSGGTIPYKITGTPLPVINILRVPEIIKQGTDLDATIEATGN